MTTTKRQNHPRLYQKQPAGTAKPVLQLQKALLRFLRNTACSPKHLCLQGLTRAFQAVKDKEAVREGRHEVCAAQG